MNNYIELDGPKKVSFGEAKYLVIFLHGWGSDGNDLIQLSEYWHEKLPNAVFLAPHGPEICSGNPQGKQWFDIMNQDNVKMYQGLEKAYDILQKYIQKSLATYKLEKDKYFLVGFSQGTMLALHTALKHQCLGIIGYSGALIENGNNQATVKNKVLLLHGKLDNVVPIQSMEKAYSKLKSFSFDVEKIAYDNLEHSINEEGLAKGSEFIKNNV